MGEELYRVLSALATEARNPDTEDLDRLGALDLVARLNAQDARVHEAVREALPAIARAAELAAASLGEGGRLIYVGAGTSGRLGVLDASECPPTFGVAPDRVVGIIAGGPPALVRSQEGIEDDPARGVADLAALDPGPADTVVGISACHRTPYTVAAVEEAARRGCRTAFITADPGADVPGEAVIRLDVGPEAVAGSTRLKAGSAQKMSLNLVSTAAMVLTGRVYRNMMVDLSAGSEKLVERGRGVVMAVTGLDYEAASDLLDRAGGRVKLALLMRLAGLDAAAAAERLAAAGGHLARALGEISS